MTNAVLFALIASVGTTTTATTASLPSVVEEAPSPPDEGVDAFRYAKYAAVIDGGWSAIMTAAWAMSARSYRAPYLNGALGLTVARVLYGTTWTVLVAINTAILRFATGDDWEGISQGSLHNQWLIGLDIPAPCERGGGGFCGVGIGAYSEISVTLSDDFEVAMTGGWIQGRFDTDERRTLIVSTWVQSPILVRSRLSRRLGPFNLELLIGAGLYHGMYNAHVHEGVDFEGTLDVPKWEIVVLHAGAGVGAHAKLAVGFFDLITLDAELDVAPFYLSWSPERPDIVGPIDSQRDGTIVWRRASVGIGLAEGVLPIRLSARIFGLELGPGPLERVGHRGLMIQFDTPFDLEPDEEEAEDVE